MIETLLKTRKLMVLAIVMLLAACNESTDLEDSLIENYVDQSIFELQAEGNMGKFGCVELVFPVTLVYPDETEGEVGSYEEMREAIVAWKEANPDARFRPKLAFPFEVVTEDGEMLTIEDASDKRQLRRRCVRNFFDRHDFRGHRHRGKKCFSLTFPLSIAYPDETVVEYEDRAALKAALRQWKADNPDADVRPMLSFPITVQLEDETTQEVGSKEELQALKETCSGS
ncbi:MAG: hypothetical protein KTR24_09455 [Saprospiraceae bacterium]|nr:hypothetical protein [Saprospiraceae bacterium]